ncbi:phosphotransferase family protein [Pseudonocardia xishanensis]|uniref:Phosphotransferase family protein n=1 Tax=Pseudonocardia xishanensis TaxID=630995 RepID=A0ABP8RTD7_9PSEU
MNATPELQTPEPALQAWLETTLDGDGPYGLEPLQVGGTSNEMWVVHDAGQGRWALRMPPEIKNAPTAHDVTREFRLLAALEGTAVPHPGPVALCADPEVLGRPFYVMAHVDGVALRDPLPDWANDAEVRAGIGRELVDGVAALSEVDWRARGLDGFGRPDGFLERQVPRWMGQLAKYRTRDLPGVEDLADWLASRRVPEQSPALLHGDYSLFNVLFRPGAPARLVAIVDWETATVGDPLVDLGWLVAQWSEPGQEPVIAGGVTQLTGMGPRKALVERYAARTGREVGEIAFYAALATFKLACIVEGAWFRYASGRSGNPRHARFERLVPDLVRHGLEITRGTWI